MTLTKRVQVPSQQLSGLAVQQYLTSTSSDRRGRKLRQKSSGPKGPTHQEGERNLGPQRRVNTATPKWLPARNGSRGIEQPSPTSRMGEGQWTTTKATDQRSRRLLRRMGGGTKGMVGDRKQGRSHGREGSMHKPQARHREVMRLTDRVVVAKMPRDSTTLAEQRTRGAAACLLKRRPTRHAFGPTGSSGHVVGATLGPRQTCRRCQQGRARPRRACGSAALKPYWGKPAVRNFRGARGNGATVDATRARNWKRRTQPSLDLRATAPGVYSPKPHARFERGPQAKSLNQKVT